MLVLSLCLLVRWSQSIYSKVSQGGMVVLRAVQHGFTVCCFHIRYISDRVLALSGDY